MNRIIIIESIEESIINLSLSAATAPGKSTWHEHVPVELPRIMPPDGRSVVVVDLRGGL
jgi:hypothetical protein